MRLATIMLTAAALPAIAMAEPPKVVTDIAPVQALVSQIMTGVGAPTQILPTGASPHGYAMRPSEARALSNANLVFWIGPELAPALERGMESLAENTEHVALLHAPGVKRLEYREGPDLKHDDHEAHDHAEKADHKDEHAHDDSHKDEHAHDENHKDEHGHEGHDHEGVDPHAWLSPENLAVWAEAIAAKLSTKDPSNAGKYWTNATAEIARIKALEAELKAALAPAHEKPFLVFHDAYQYFEHSFGVEAAATLLSSDAERPGAAALLEIREGLKEISGEHTVCIFAEPQFDTSLIDSITDGTDIHVGRLDPMGTELPQDANLHRAILASLATNMLACLTGNKS